MLGKHKLLIVEDDIDQATILENNLQENFTDTFDIQTAYTLEKALFLYHSFEPDLLILDIHFGDRTIFDFLYEKEYNEKVIIFTTSSKEFAISAIPFRPFGYLVKPIQLLELNKLIFSGVEFLESLKSKAFEVISIHTANKIEFIKTEDILYLEADGSYTNVFLANQTITSSRHLKIIEHKLPNHFIRIHAKYLVNTHKILSLNKSKNPELEMINLQKLPIARRRLDFVLNQLPS
ncbi:MAG: LytTR family DNA-binding domain-containing protein [Flavobacteriales bacterium]|jgi:two-component system LytT family response regulator|nr:LytTR family DNA-binding domain-containing protein [Flavobacteriales bacterium]